MSSWDEKKLQGDRAEEAVAQALATAYGAEVLRTTGRVHFDLLMLQRFEVKHDLKAAQTGNVAIEIAHRGQDSGVNTSTAGFWAIVVGSECLLIFRRKLSALIDGERVCLAGDDHETLVALLPVEKLRRQATVIRLDRE